MTEALGWVSSLVLLATVVEQIRKQWKARSAEGVSQWLFVGQAAASAGFTIYSLMVANWVFVVTNALMLLSALCGCLMTRYFRASSGDRSQQGAQRDLKVG